ncbi:molybdopterin oxidoreductase family protein [Siculibacillus lacustris]|uniref:Molybdopterin oxidoreductase family protein n=1 Tax=Siculibacillus lacustris TaxID=1549641 RepID=A0A4Q9VMW5_9HYPH|nr:molybdopterin oxidoreductase family protein [Siculibacillus lacustris]TBW36955.1 molybdopterin oxidoreductase family protein [Siculibacillus lacustris]
MNRPSPVRVARTTCPHDCPSTCSLEVEVLDAHTIGRVRGSTENTYTAGVICAKVARYAERVHSPKRLLKPLLRTGPKGSGQFREIGWEEALDRVAEAFLAAEAAHGAESVWPYFYAGTMGQVQRDGINRLRHAKKYSEEFGSICTNLAWTGWIAGTGRLTGVDPREMAKSDLVVIWGTNAVATQVNVMTHAIRARKERGARIAVIDVYRTATMDQADIGLVLRPGTDAALACAVMHVLFRDNLADRAFLASHSDVPEELEAHLATRTPEWAAAITGLTVGEIEGFARAIGTTPKTFFRLGYGFSRQRNGTVAMHAASCVPVVAGSWRHEGGGAFHNNGAIFKIDKSLVEGSDLRDPSVRRLDQCRIGAILNGDSVSLKGGAPVKAMLIQNTNPLSVAPDQEKVRSGFAREDLFVAVHEQFMTDTARMADVVLPATMFLEHDDLYRGGGNQYLLLGPKVIEPPGEARENHRVICDLAGRLGASHPGFDMTAREHVDWMLRKGGYGTFEGLVDRPLIDCQPEYETAHFLGGFGYPDGRFRFAPNWTEVAASNDGPMGPWRDMPRLPDQWDVIETATDAHPFRLVTPPARNFLNSSFAETATSAAKEGAPTVKMHPADLARLGLADGETVRLVNERGAVTLAVKSYDGLQIGVLVAEGIFPNTAFVDGRGINTLTGADQPAPYGGAAFHDVKVRVERAIPAEVLPFGP